VNGILHDDSGLFFVEAALMKSKNERGGCLHSTVVE
jgi:hypothetical protein